MRFLFPLLCLPIAACAAFQPVESVVAQPAGNWREVATRHDRDRLRDWRATFVAALRDAQAGGHSAVIAGEGALLDPDAAIPGPPIANGNYRCRVIKVGARSPGMLSYVAYPYFQCQIRQERDLQGFAKLTGSQRQVGVIFPGDALRQVFLGTVVLGDEARALQYGRDHERDIAAFVERIGENRWRMVMPQPAFESQIDIMELVPVQ